MIRFSQSEVLKCFQFAKGMIGNHNPNMIMQRDDWEIFRDDVRGKLGEIAVKKTILSQFPHLHINADIDYSITPRGQWDFTDLIIGGRFVSIKSVKGRSKFLMVETNRYNDDGTYKYMNGEDQPVQINAYILVSVDIEPEIRWADMRSTTVEQIKHPSPNVTRNISAMILGGVTHEDFWLRKHFAPKGIQCNLSTLQAIASGATQIPPAPAGLKKTQVLQQDNFLLSCDELKPLDVLFKNYTHH